MLFSLFISVMGTEAQAQVIERQVIYDYKLGTDVDSVRDSLSLRQSFDRTGKPRLIAYSEENKNSLEKERQK